MMTNLAVAPKHQQVPARDENLRSAASRRRALNHVHEREGQTAIRKARKGDWREEQND